MQFNTWEERQLAVKKATEELGQAYGEIKFKEFMLKEVSQSFVAGSVQQAPTSEEVKEEPKPVAKKKATKKKAEPKVEPKAEEVKEEPVAEEPVVEEPKAEEPVVEEPATDECPIKSTDDLRAYMTQRYKELGGGPARDRLITALKEATGTDKASDVAEDKYADAYAALLALA